MNDFPPTSALKFPISDADALASTPASAVAETLVSADTPVLRLWSAFPSAPKLTDGKVTKMNKKVIINININ